MDVEAPEKYQPISSSAQSGTGSAWHGTQIRKAESSEEFIILQNSSFQTAWKKKHSNAKTSKRRKAFQAASVIGENSLLASGFLSLHTRDTWEQIILVPELSWAGGCAAAPLVSAH